MNTKNCECPNCHATLQIRQGGKGYCEYCDKEFPVEGVVKNAEIAEKENIVGSMEMRTGPSDLHWHLVALLKNAEYIPLDVFEKTQILSVEKFCVAGYLFDCSITANYTYDVGNEREREHTSVTGNTVTVSTRTHTEWTSQNSSHACSETVFCSGNKEFSDAVLDVWRDGDPSNLADIEDASAVSTDTITYGYNNPVSAAFDDKAKNYIEKSVKSAIRQQIRNQYWRNLNVSSPRVDKTNKRVYLNLSKVAYFYDNRTYIMWVAGDGHRHSGRYPVDTDRQLKYDFMRAAAEKELPAYNWKLIAATVFMLWVGSGDKTIFFIIGLIMAAFSVWTFVRRRKIKKDREAFAAFDQERIAVVNKFIAERKGLAGILQAEAANKPNAFPKQIEVSQS